MKPTYRTPTQILDDPMILPAIMVEIPVGAHIGSYDLINVIAPLCKDDRVMAKRIVQRLVYRGHLKPYKNGMGITIAYAAAKPRVNIGLTRGPKKK